MDEATEHTHWDEAAMALYKLQAIADGEPFADLVIHETETEDLVARWKPPKSRSGLAKSMVMLATDSKTIKITIQVKNSVFNLMDSD